MNASNHLRVHSNTLLLELVFIVAAALLAVVPCARGVNANFIVINSTDLTISGDGDNDPAAFKGVPFHVVVEGNIARFYISGDLTLRSTDTVTLTGTRPISLFVGGNAVFESGAGAVIDASGLGVTPGAGGGTGGAAGGGGGGGSGGGSSAAAGGLGGLGVVMGNGTQGGNGGSQYGQSGNAGQGGASATAGQNGVNSPNGGGLAGNPGGGGAGASGGAGGERGLWRPRWRIPFLRGN